MTAVPTKRHEGLYFALRNGKLLAGLAVLVPLLVLAAAAPLIAEGDPNAYVAPPASPPSAENWFGTTMFGQDIFAQFVYGLRVTFVVGVLGGGLAAIIGMVDRLHRRVPRRDRRRGAEHAHQHRPGPAGAGGAADRQRLPRRPQRRRAGTVHRAHLLAVGGQGDQGPDVLAAHA